MNIETEQELVKVSNRLHNMPDDELVELHDEVRKGEGKYNTSLLLACKEEMAQRFIYRIVADKQINALDFGI